jgi:P4 family phage/plasmid primase-like protien
MKKDAVLDGSRTLHALGWGILWLRPKEKRPVEARWTSGERATWAELEASYHPGYNVGVRTGTPSRTADGFLCCVDIDIGSDDSRHLQEALACAAGAIGPGLCGVVRSGRGNGSRHYYGQTARPFKGYRLGRSTEEVRIHKPSKVPSKKDREKFTPLALEEGWRLSPAWQVDVYSEGRQMVLPPSVHPDSGKSYRWARPLAKMPIWTFDNAVPSAPEEKKVPQTREDFTVQPVELSWLPISDRVRNGIVSCDGVTDRSAFLMPAWKALRSAGLTVSESLTVLTDPKHAISACARDRRGSSRKSQADWILRYTGETVDAASSPEVFRALPLPEAPKEEKPSFYGVGKNGALVPKYDVLLAAFREETPYRSIADMKNVFVFRQTHYQDLTPTEIKAFAEKTLEPKPSNRIRTEFYEKVLVNEVARREFFYRTTEGKANFLNGVLDLNAGSALQPHSEAFGFRGVLPYEYDPDAQCPVFRAWLDSVMLGDRDLVAAVQEFMGYIIRGGEYRFHKALWVEGRGRNGKSTFIDVLKALIGPGNYSTLSIKSLVNDRFVGAELDGKIANFSEETSPEELRDSGPFKNLTGDGEITAQKKFGDPFFFRNRAKLVMSYNQVPDLSDLSDGMLSRPLIIPFRKKIREDEQDHQIKEKLCAELSGIFNFALEGWHRLERQNRFTVGDRSRAALKNVRTSSCNVFQWVENYVVFGDNEDNEAHQRTAVQLFDSYRGKERYPYNFKKFSMRLADHPEMHRRKRLEGHDRKRIYWGVEKA